jgi:hypothetical protein
MKKYNRLICLILSVTICLALSSCSTKADEETTTDNSTTTTVTQSETTQTTTEIDESTTVTDSTTSTTTQSTTEKKTTTTKKSVTKAKSSDNDTSISLNEALDVLSDFYGVAYNVNATVSEDGWQYFAVYDKYGTKYASVKVNLSTADAVETIVSTGETNEYNLLV